MASVKGMKFEQQLLAATAEVKQIINEQFSSIESSDIKQKMLIATNNLFDIGHSESRRLRKACAFMHQRIELLEGILRKNGITIPVDNRPTTESRAITNG